MRSREDDYTVAGTSVRMDLEKLGKWLTIVPDFRQLDDRTHFLALSALLVSLPSLVSRYRFVYMVPSNDGFMNQDRVFPTHHDR